MIACGAVLAFFAVAIGAFGAHGLENFLQSRYSPTPQQLDKRLHQFDVGVRYHLPHAIALMVLPAALPGRRYRPAACCLIAGVVLFSGSLYLLVVTNTAWLGAITPIGGLAWLVGWAWVAAVAAARGRRDSEPEPA